jgi:hypothetical protein
MKTNIAISILLILALALTGCAGGDKAGAAKDWDVEALYTQMESSVDMPGMLELDDTMKFDFCGVDAAELNQSKMLVCEDSLRTDEIWLLEVKDAAGMREIDELIAARIKAKEDESITYSPEQYAIVQKHNVIKNGNFVALIVSPSVDELSAVVENY